MKFGPIEIYWNPLRTATVHQMVLDYLNNEPRVSEGIHRMARSEVKNYIAECAERAEIPFISVETMLAKIEERTRLMEAEATALREHSDRLRQSLQDAPEIETLPNGHTSTCTCPDKYTKSPDNVLAHCDPRRM